MKRRISPACRATHLYLQEKHLPKIPIIKNGSCLQTVYLYDNEITKIENLEPLPNLEYLYLQNNQINKMENLSSMRKLKKLYIGKNKIAVLEGLQYVDSLQELHIEKQDLVDNMHLCFDPRTITNISASLTVLNISHNKIISLTFLTPLIHLVYLDASHNNLDDVKDVYQTLRNWTELLEAQLIGNPVCKKHRYREDIIANTCQLKVLDGKDITDLSRSFLKKFEDRKTMSESKHNISRIDHVIKGIPGNYPEFLRKGVTESLVKEIKCEQLKDSPSFDIAEPVHLSWNFLPKRTPLTHRPRVSTLRNLKRENHNNMLVKKTTIKIKNSSC
ncbi:protein phosphatase 1 regulatory subunit 42-like [Euwallacea fornicatus]|uniref:protein phosphatase 1 regulatory subunit 42-like n=1 Tax=Euwallacea fornicatus TaxID=995702 RepID=UPI00338F9615